MPVPRMVLENGIGVVSPAVADSEGLTQQLLCQGPLDLHSDNTLWVWVEVCYIDFRPFELHPELRHQLVVPRLVAGDIDIYVFPAQEQENAGPAQGCEQ